MSAYVNTSAIVRANVFTYVYFTLMCIGQALFMVLCVKADFFLVTRNYLIVFSHLNFWFLQRKRVKVVVVYRKTRCEN